MNKQWHDPFLDKDSGLLRNRLNITDAERLSTIESTFATIRNTELQRNPLKEHHFDLAHLQAIHKYIFQDIYDWAGEVRNFHLQKGETKFAPPTIIHQGSSYLFGQLAKEKHLQGLDTEGFSRRAGYYLGEINHLHPFREGNGRTQRCFINQLAQQNNYYIAWDKLTQAEMIQASIEADRGDYSLMAKLIRDNLKDREYELIEAKYSARSRAEISHAAEGSHYKGKVIGMTERYVVQELEDTDGILVLHNRRSLTTEIAAPSNQSIEISYPHGKAGLVYENSATRKEVVKEIKYEK